MDDDIDDIEMLEEALQEVDPDFVSFSFYNGSEALHQLKLNNNEPDYIFLDLNMPRLNGFDFLCKLQENEKWKKIPVVIYTTSKLDADKQRCLNAGATQFFTKPSNFNELVVMLSQLLTIKL